MKLFFTILLLLVFAHSHWAYALDYKNDKMIYGNDNRKLVSEISEEESPWVYRQSKSIMAQIPNWRITTNPDKSISIQTKDLQTGLNFCEGERFLDQPLVAACTAFLVGPDLIVTAGHCIKDKYDCKKQTWVLDYDTASEFISPVGKARFLKEKTYSCSELVTWSLSSKLDYAIVKLDRKVEDRAPLKIRREGKTSNNESLMVIGHPLGMPKIMTDNIFIRDNSLTYVFKTNADTFSGNSGSPVFGLLSGLVEGILVRGDDDFITDINLNCQRSARCADNECRGESVQRSTFLPFKYIPKI